MSVVLPTLPQHNTQSIKLTSSASNNVPQFGGPTQRIARLGDKFTYDVATRSLSYTQAMGVIALLVQGVATKVVCPVQQPGLTIGNPGTPVVVSGSGTTLNIGGLTASYALQAGQYLSIINGGKRFLHMVSTAAVANGSGAATVSIYPMLRSALAGGDVIEIATPKIEGFLADTSHSWSVDFARTIGLTFSITEAL